MGSASVLTSAAPRLRRAALLALLALLAAAAYPLLQPSLLRAWSGFYPEHESWRQAQLDQRLLGYGSFLWLLFGALACFWVVLWRSKALAALAERSRRAAPLALLVLALLILGLDYHFSTRDWVRLGRPCWDNYCYYAELLAKWLQGQNVERRLVAFMREDYHANSPLGPLLIACLRLATGLETVAAYRVCVFLATLGAVLLLWRGLLVRLAVGRDEVAAVLVLFATHLIVVRSSFFPQTDALVLLWSTALLAALARRAAAPRAWHGPVCFLLLATGLFVKLSFLPALALVPAWRLAVALHERRRPDLRALGSEVLLYSLLPLALYLLVQWRLGLLGQYGAEFRAIAGSDSHPAFVAMSLLHAVAVLGPLSFIGRRRFGALEAGALAWTLLYLAALWLSRASGWDRFYLAVLPALAVTAAPGLSVVKQRLGRAPVWGGALLLAALNYAALWLELYY